jgi:hypothetical protein
MLPNLLSGFNPDPALAREIDPPSAPGRWTGIIPDCSRHFNMLRRAMRVKLADGKGLVTPARASWR